MSFNVVIPARYASTRLPGKPLADIAGRAMILRVLDKVHMSAAREVVVATDDERIAECVTSAGFDAQMTRADHESGSDRVMEVAALRGWASDSLVVNVQGDEPLIPPAVIDQVANLLVEADVATLSTPILSASDLANPDVVKVVSSDSGLALYFSRSAIPYDRDQTTPVEKHGPWQRHIGIYGYRISALRRFVDMPMAALERLEKLEQLRILAADMKIRVASACESVPAGVDSPEDLERVLAALRS